MELKFSARKKNKDNMLLLVSHVPFQEEVQKIRSAFDVDAQAFKMGSEKAAQWERKFTLQKARQLAHAIRGIIATYHLPDNYEHYIRLHIVYGTVNAPLNNFDIIPFSRETSPSESRHITVNIYARLTKQEERDLRIEISRMARNLPDFKPLNHIERKIEREKEIRDLKERNKQPDREYHAEYREVVKSAKQARENLRELADHRKKRFGKK